MSYVTRYNMVFRDGSGRMVESHMGQYVPYSYCESLQSQLAAANQMCKGVVRNYDGLEKDLYAANERADGLQRIVDEARAQPAAPVLPIDVVRFAQSPPCYICGYNGVGYFSPATHPCAEKYHAAMGAPVSPATVAVPSLEAVLAEYERQTRALPAQDEILSRGCSTFNWQMSVIRDLRKIAASQREGGGT